MGEAYPAACGARGAGDGGGDCPGADIGCLGF
jgi:hypothetical protein